MLGIYRLLDIVGPRAATSGRTGNLGHRVEHHDRYEAEGEPR
jgi:hypothetical protein